MYSDLVHASRMREAQHHADVGLLVVTDQLECRRTAFALVGHLAHAYLVADHFDWLIALDRFPVHIGNIIFRMWEKKSVNQSQIRMLPSKIFTFSYYTHSPEFLLV